MYLVPNYLIYHSGCLMFAKNKQIDPWRGKTPTPEGFNKESTEGMDVIAFALLKELVLDKDEDLTPFPAFIIWRLYTKAYTWDAKPENLEFFRSQIPNFNGLMDDYIYEKMKSQGVEEFAKFIKEEANRLSPKVKKVFDAARALASLIEFEELKEKIRPDAKTETEERVSRRICDFSDLPHFLEIAFGVGEYGKIKELLKNISASRYIFRWQGYMSPIKCSILEHMLESAVISYMMNLEKGDVSKEDMLRDFWVLMFHDLSEVWTDDIPSPVKDNMKFFVPVSKVLELLNFHTSERVEKLIELVNSDGGITLEEQRELLSAFDRETFWDLFKKAFPEEEKEKAWKVAERFKQLSDSDELNVCELTDLLNTSIMVSFRIFTEFQELKALEEHFYSELPERVEKFFRDGVMLDDVKDNEKKKFYKAADYFSADLEVFWNIKGGSGEYRFIEILEESASKDSNRTPEQRKLLEHYVNRCKLVSFFD